MKIIIDDSDWAEPHDPFLVEQLGIILVNSATAGHLQFVQQALAQHPDPATVINAALGAACAANHLEIAQFLYQQGADIHYYQDVILRTAAEKNKSRVIEWVLSCGVSDEAKRDALRDAMDRSNLNAIKTLAAAGATLGNSRNTLLIRACHQNRWQILQALHHHGIAFDDLHRQMLAIACGANHVDTLKWLFQSGANINPDNQEPILEACKYGRLFAIKWLVFHGVDIRANGDQCLRTALQYQKHAVARWLCFRGAPINGRIYFDCHGTEYEPRGACLDYPDDSSQLVDWLIANGLAGAKNPLIKTDLENACCFGNLERVEWLLEHGAKLSSLLRPAMFSYVCNTGDQTTAKWLLSRGAVPDLKDAFCQAAGKGRMSTMDWLTSKYPEYDVPVNAILVRICDRSTFHAPIADWLVDHGADVAHNDYQILVTACQDRKDQVLDWLFQQPEIMMNAFDRMDSWDESARTEIMERARFKKAKRVPSAAQLQ